MTFGHYLRKLRRSRSVPLARLSEAVGVAASVLGDVEAGRRLPRATEVRRLAAYFGIAEAEMLARAGYLGAPTGARSTGVANRPLERRERTRPQDGRAEPMREGPEVDDLKLLVSRHADSVDKRGLLVALAAGPVTGATLSALRGAVRGDQLDLVALLSELVQAGLVAVATVAGESCFRLRPGLRAVIRDANGAFADRAST